jgi:Contractile injection system tube protein/LysM domain
MAGANSKLTIVRGTYRGNKADFSGASDTLTVTFNPSEYTIEKKNTYSEAAIPGLDAPIIQFSRGEARTLSMELLLDTYTYDDQADIRDAHIKTLEKFLAVDGELHAPPPCKVVWGSLVFVGVLEDTRKQFVLFLEDGRPVRARVTLTWKEYIPVEIQVRRMPRASPDKRKIHTFCEGDSIWKIAYDAYGDSRYWKFISEANAIDDPLRIEPGQRIAIPALKEGWA